MRQTELLLQKNEKLVQENTELHRQVLLAREVEEDLARRNHMNQKTMRILMYKLHEKQLASKSIKNSEEEEIKRLICHQEQIKSDIHEEHEEIEKMKIYIQERTMAVESSSGAEEAMKFLYACLEDVEMEKLCRGTNDQMLPISDLESSLKLERTLEIPDSLDQLTVRERRQLLMHLLRTAISLRAVSQNSSFLEHSRGLWPSLLTESKSAMPSVLVDDILSIPIEGLQLDKPSNPVGSNIKPISIGVQTETMVFTYPSLLSFFSLAIYCSITIPLIQNSFWANLQGL